MSPPWRCCCRRAAAPPTATNFDVAVYDRAYEVWEMADLEWLRTREGDALRLRLHRVVAK